VQNYAKLPPNLHYALFIIHKYMNKKGILVNGCQAFGGTV
jgi:hypothetical protein